MDPSAAFAMPSAASSSSFDLSEVDFEYVEKLTKRDAKKLRGIIIALEQEAAYPDLLRTAKQKLKEIDPKRSTHMHTQFRSVRGREIRLELLCAHLFVALLCLLQSSSHL